MRNSRVNWGSILAGVVTASGVLLCISYLGRSLGLNGPVGFPFPLDGRPLGFLPDPGPVAIAFAVLANAFGFAIAGYAVASLGNFRRGRATVLHALASFSVTIVAIHYFSDGSLFVARPGFPLNLRPQLPPLTPAVSWLQFVSMTVGAVTCTGAAYLCWQRGQRRGFNGRSERDLDQAA